ncbi:MAG: amidohydrolase family protein [Saprospiraceae bacterium]|nr:amidohydrolase family protein [Saprospiraceae bacterium]
MIETVKIKVLYPLLMLLSWTFSIGFAQVNDLMIRDISVVNVLDGGVRKADVFIEGGIIRDISDHLENDTGVKELDGTSKWLIPGLIDAHIHLFQSGGIYTRPDVINLTAYRSYEQEISWLRENAGDLLKRYLRCGITSVIDMGGPFYNFNIRDTFHNTIGYPNIFLTGPLISTYQPEEFQIEDSPIIKVHSADEARSLVRKEIPYHPDFIKIWYITLPTQTAESTYDIVAATIEESHHHGLKVAVHATELNTAKLAVKAGADILVHSIDDPVDEDFIALIRENNVTYIPTLVVSGNYNKAFVQNTSFSDEDFNFANPVTLGSLFDSRHFPPGNIFEQLKPYLPKILEEGMIQDSIKLENLKLLREEGISISTGTDAGNIGTLHGSSFFEEISAMQKSGMSNLELLTASTINAAKAIGKEKELGSIDIGKSADLIVLSSNPLEDINAIKDLELVIKDGYMLPVDSIIMETPADLVQKQVNGYNARNMEAFLAPYAEDVELYAFPNTLTDKGKANIRPGYEDWFAKIPDLHVEIVDRIVSGNTVIDQERITGIPGVDYLEAVAIYKIENNKIVKVYFVEKE